MDGAALLALLKQGMECHQRGDLVQAEQIYRQVHAHRPDHPHVLYLLGTLAGQTHRPDLAAELIGRAVQKSPAAGYQLNYGLALLTLGRSREAIDAFREMARQQPAMAEAHSNLGSALLQAGQPADALASLREAIRLNPTLVEAQLDLGNALRANGDRPGALDAYHQVLRLRPDFAEAHYNLGNVHQDAGQFDLAIADYREAIRLKPRDPAIWNNLGAVYLKTANLPSAVDAFQSALSCNPQSAEALQNLAAAFRLQGRLDEALAACRQALVLAPDSAEARNTLGAILALRGAIPEALACIRQALRLRPDDASAHSNLIFAMHYDPATEASDLRQEQGRWNQQHARPVPRLTHTPPAPGDASRRLRVGYLSPDLYDHVLGRNIIPLFRHHDRAQFEIFTYAASPRADHLTKDFQSFSDHWRNIAALSDSAAADMIRQDRIDILVDLSLHMAGNRLPLMARQPAPLQVSFAGYPGATGLEAIAYHLTDPHLEPPETTPLTAHDQAIHLPSYWCYEVTSKDPPVSPLPMDSAGIVTFGCLCNFQKVGDMAVALWAPLLGALHSSRLMLLTDPGSHRDRVLDLFDRHGISRDRIVFAARRSAAEYLRLYHQIDLALDTLPYNGHTTSLDAFWMGVPVMTLVGTTIVGRGGLSLAMNLNLPELVARSPAEFSEKTLALAADAPRLRTLRAGLRPRMEHSILTDAQAFARHIESAYRRMWNRR